MIAGTGGLFTAVLYVYSAGLFITPLKAAFGWSRIEVTVGMMIVGVVAAFGNPFIGLVIDRFGPGRVALIGVVAYSSAIAALGSAGPGVQSWILGWLAVALASLAISVPVWLIAVARAFHTSRGLALAVSYCGSSLAAMIVPYLTERAIHAFGWSGAYRTLGGLGLIIGGASALTLLRYAAGRSVATKEAGAGHRGARRILFSSRFWRIAAMSVLVTLGVIALTVHFVSIAGEHGMARAEAAALAGIIGISGLAGRIATGALLDRFPGSVIGAVIYSVPAIACLLVALLGAGPLAMAFMAVAIGLALGSELDIMAYVTTRYFGLANYGLLFGILTGLVGCGAGFGPVVASGLRDLTDSYDLLLLTLSVCFAVSAILAGSLGPYPEEG